jgi:hypothetical protein
MPSSGLRMAHVSLRPAVLRDSSAEGITFYANRIFPYHTAEKHD